ncbi:MAG: response regulator [Gemmatimonadales bacterium]
MNQAPRVLLVDDEETFLLSTADLFTTEGYECRTAADADQAIAELDLGPFDLIISDIRMPANPDLRLVRTVEERGLDTPVILVTGYPSLQTAVEAVDLAVAAYLIKPVDFDELLDRSRRALNDRAALGLIATARERAAQWTAELDRIEASLRAGNRGNAPEGISAFVDSTARTLVATTADLCAVSGALAGARPDAHPCRVLSCPRHQSALTIIRDAIDTLEATRQAFKSKQLGELRQRLETFVKQESAMP